MGSKKFVQLEADYSRQTSIHSQGESIDRSRRRAAKIQACRCHFVWLDREIDIGQLLQDLGNLWNSPTFLLIHWRPHPRRADLINADTRASQVNSYIIG